MTNGPRVRAAGGRTATLLMLADVVVPVVLYYVARGSGARPLPALAISGAGSLTLNVVGLVLRRRLELLGVTVLASVLIGLVTSVATHDVRIALARDAGVTLLWGLAFAVSAATERPAAYAFSRTLLQGRRIPGVGPTTAEPWDDIWSSNARFRRIWRVTTVMWAGALVLDAGIRALMATTLPVDRVPLLTGLLWPVTLVVLQVATNGYIIRAGLWRILVPRHEERRTRP